MPIVEIATFAAIHVQQPAVTLRGSGSAWRVLRGGWWFDCFVSPQSQEKEIGRALLQFTITQLGAPGRWRVIYPRIRCLAAAFCIRASLIIAGDGL